MSVTRIIVILSVIASRDHLLTTHSWLLHHHLFLHNVSLFTFVNRCRLARHHVVHLIDIRAADRLDVVELNRLRLLIRALIGSPHVVAALVEVGSCRLKLGSSPVHTGLFQMHYSVFEDLLFFD